MVVSVARGIVRQPVVTTVLVALARLSARILVVIVNCLDVHHVAVEVRDVDSLLAAGTLS